MYSSTDLEGSVGTSVKRQTCDAVLHLLCVQREGRRQYWVVPLRSSTSLIHDEQRRLDDNDMRGMEIH
jgi:hypothetical protein